ncbi:hypothetical protein [Chroococcidiopsis thermalis]|uniref:hypothetical protein n=1 Tax=Chroococcidiopsis thermalis TaxID=54299 RepID=UPI00031F9F9C|nr:hypothetical protein [Chroococcidiopsis thermalis]
MLSVHQKNCVYTKVYKKRAEEAEEQSSRGASGAIHALIPNSEFRIPNSPHTLHPFFTDN